MKRPRDWREVETAIMIAPDPAGSAVVVMCWDNGGTRLVGLMLVRRSDGYACFIDLPDTLRERLATLDRQFVEDHAAQLMAIAYEGLPDCEFEEDRVVSGEFLQQGYQPAEAGMMRHIPAELIASNPHGVATWQAAGFIVDVGEINLDRSRGRRTIH